MPVAKTEIFLFKRLVDTHVGLAHCGKNACRAMLGRDLELTADVMRDELIKERGILVEHEVIKADARADKYSLHTVERLDIA